jgi:hypothetical protein
MKLTMNLTREVPVNDYGISARTKTETVVDVTGVEFTSKLTASFLRALADEIDPKFAPGGPVIGGLR